MKWIYSKKAWFKNIVNHIQGLLVSPSEIEEEDETIIEVLQQLEIKFGPFDIHEYKLSKRDKAVVKFVQSL